MSQDDGYREPAPTAEQRAERQWRAERRAKAIDLARVQHEELLAEPEWLDILRGLGIASCLISLLILIPCSLMAIVSGDWPTPWPVRVAAGLVAGVGVVALLTSGIDRVLHGPDVDWR